MSGAAGIAAAKNRRSRADPVKKTVIDCNSINGTCAPKNTNQQQLQPQSRSIPMMDDKLVDPISMKILGPMPTPQVLKIHEQRLNRIDEKLSQGIITGMPIEQNVITSNTPQEHKEQIDLMEEKIRMLEEVIMNLQLTITNVQAFAMETNLAMMKIKRGQEETTQDIETVEVSQDVISNAINSVEPTSLDVPHVVNNDEIVISNITFTNNN